MARAKTQRTIDYLTTRIKTMAKDAEDRFNIPKEPDLEKEILAAIANGSARTKSEASILIAAKAEMAYSCTSYGHFSGMPLAAIFNEPPLYKERRKERQRVQVKLQKTLDGIRNRAEDIVDRIHLGEFDGLAFDAPLKEFREFLESVFKDNQ